MFLFLLEDSSACLLHFVSGKVRDCGYQFFKNTPETVFKICLKINLVDFFSFEVYFLPLRTAGFFKTPYKQPVEVRFGNRISFKYLLNEDGLGK